MMPQSSQVYWTDFIIKKTAHLIEYAILGLLNYRAFRGSGVVKKKALYFAFAISILYAASDELHQYFVPGRESRVRDVIIDAVGCCISLVYIKLR
jgi:VanZ family protein